MNIIEKNSNKLNELCKKYKVLKLYVFGSILREDFNKDSDIDFLISFDKNISIKQYTDNYFDLHYKLRDLFKRNIDIVTERTLSNPYFIKSVEETKQLIYEA